MRTIWKFPLRLSDFVDVPMPKGAEILCCQAQHEVLCLWAIVDTDAEHETRKFRVAGTGHPVNATNAHYIGTAKLHGGAFVFHVFELKTT